MTDFSGLGNTRTRKFVLGAADSNIDKAWSVGPNACYMKKCPYCAEEIQEEAVKCKHCMEFLDPSKRPTPPALPGFAAKRADELPWYLRTGFIVLTFAMVPPLAIPLVWLRPKLHWAYKLTFSAAILLVTWFMIKVTAALVDKYMEAIEMINGMGI